METQKRVWEKPQLIILARGTPEESVLTHCKYIGFAGTTAPNDLNQSGCDGGPDSKNCGNCQARSGS